MSEVKTKGGIIVTDKEIPDIHLSPSQMGMYSRCQQAWYYRYVYPKISIPPNKNLTAGSVYDDALTNNYNQKIKTKTDLTQQEILDIADTSFSIREDETEWYGESPIETKDTVMRCLKEYMETGMSEKIQPIAVQKLYDVHFEGMDWTMKGISDIETEDGYIIDNKTTGKTPSRDLEQIDQNHKFQMDVYAISKKYTEGITEGEKRRIDYVVKLVNPKVISLELPPLTAQDAQYFKKKVSVQFQQMELLRSGKIRPDTNRSHFMCSQKQCGYWQLCLKDNGGTIKK